MIKIKKNKKIELEPPKFLCDGDLSEKLNKYDMLKLFNSFSFNAMIGRPGSGKTSLLVSFLNNSKIFKKTFHNIYVVMPTSSRESMKNNIFKKHSENKLFDELTLSTIQEIYKNLLKNSEDNESSLLILDDVGAVLKNKQIQQTLRLIIYNRRHLKCQIIILLQSYLSIPKEIRKLFSNVIMFKPSKVEFINLFDEIFENKKDMTMDIMKFVYTDPHDYLVLNVETQKMYKGFDEIIIEE